MKVNSTTKLILAYRREEKQMFAEGWERLTRHTLLDMDVGGRVLKIFSECKISDDGRTLWVKFADRKTAGELA